MSPHLAGDKERGLRRGFTFAEVLMALAIGAAVIATAVVSYQAVTQSGSGLGTYGPVQLPDGVLFDFYKQSGAYVDAYFAPNYGRVAQAEVVRDELYEDISHASAVFCLARTTQADSALRPTDIPIAVDYDARRLDTPEAFRTFLETALPVTAGRFSAYRGASAAQNLSIFVLRPSNDADELLVQSIYEVDFVPAVTPAGTYASVRRYQGNFCTDFYDIFYPASSGTVAFLPVVASFERAVRTAVAESDYDKYKVAANRPFYFVWWPDPAVPALENSGPANISGGNLPQPYQAMTGRTSLFMVLPMFPSL
jgi:prepilin-type N-terminal cleavage/methylation domain-containing protein